MTVCFGTRYGGAGLVSIGTEASDFEDAPLSSRICKS